MTARHRTRWTTVLHGAAVVVTMSGVFACGLGGGTIRLLQAGADEPGFKLLRPNVRTRSCGAVLWPYGDRAGGDLLDRAVVDLVAQNREADTIRDLHVNWRGVDLLVAHVGCVSARGDVGRTIPLVTLPHLHGGHMSHPE